MPLRWDLDPSPTLIFFFNIFFPICPRHIHIPGLFNPPRSHPSQNTPPYVDLVAILHGGLTENIMLSQRADPMTQTRRFVCFIVRRQLPTAALRRFRLPVVVQTSWTDFPARLRPYHHR